MKDVRTIFKNVSATSKVLATAARGVGASELFARVMRGVSPLELAASTGNDAILARLITNAGALQETDPTSGRTALHAAAKASQPSSVRLLLRAGADAGVRDRLGWEPLHYAAMTADGSRLSIELLGVLLAAGADVNAVGGKQEQTALHLASATGRPESVTLIFPTASRRTRASAAAASAATAAPVAVTELVQPPTTGRAAVVAFLVRAGADVDATDGRGWTPLHYAATACLAGENLKLTQVLIAAGADSAARTSDGGRTPLHHAAATGLLDVVTYLLAHGADPNLADSAGVLPVESAMAMGHDDVAALLASRGQ